MRRAAWLTVAAAAAASIPVATGPSTGTIDPPRPPVASADVAELAPAATPRPDVAGAPSSPHRTSGRVATAAPAVAPPADGSVAPAVELPLTRRRPARTCVVTTKSASACDALWDIGLAAPGSVSSFDLTLRNDSGVDAAALEVTASSPCETKGTAALSGTGDLCEVVQLAIQRFATAARRHPVECVYGGGGTTTCELSEARTLADFSALRAATFDHGFANGSAAHLRVTLRLPDVDNRFQRRSAVMNLTWQLRP